jgi:hypothetical protein
VVYVLYAKTNATTAHEDIVSFITTIKDNVDLARIAGDPSITISIQAAHPYAHSAPAKRSKIADYEAHLATRFPAIATTPTATPQKASAWHKPPSLSGPKPSATTPPAAISTTASLDSDLNTITKAINAQNARIGTLAVAVKQIYDTIDDLQNSVQYLISKTLDAIWTQHSDLIERVNLEINETVDALRNGAPPEKEGERLHQAIVDEIKKRFAHILNESGAPTPQASPPTSTPAISPTPHHSKSTSPYPALLDLCQDMDAEDFPPLPTPEDVTMTSNTFKRTIDQVEKTPKSLKPRPLRTNKPSKISLTPATDSITQSTDDTANAPPTPKRDNRTSQATSTPDHLCSVPVLPGTSQDSHTSHTSPPLDILETPLPALPSEHRGATN